MFTNKLAPYVWFNKNGDNVSPKQQKTRSVNEQV